MTRFGYVMATYVSVFAVGALSFVHVTPRLIWNASASAPIGLYSIHQLQRLTDDDLVAVNPPERLSRFLARRDYLAAGVPLLKRIVARPGQTVCRTGSVITVDGAAMGLTLARDRMGRPLPVWQGCTRIAAGQVFLMNRRVPDSFDGRYFGPLSTAAIIGRAVPLWTDEDANGRFAWRARSR